MELDLYGQTWRSRSRPPLGWTSTMMVERDGMEELRSSFPFLWSAYDPFWLLRGWEGKWVVSRWAGWSDLRLQIQRWVLKIIWSWSGDEFERDPEECLLKKREMMVRWLPSSFQAEPGYLPSHPFYLAPSISVIKNPIFFISSESNFLLESWRAVWYGCCMNWRILRFSLFCSSLSNPLPTSAVSWTLRSWYWTAWCSHYF